MTDKWDRSIKSDFNNASSGKQQEPPDRSSKGSEQVKNTKLGLHGGPPPPKGPGMAAARQKHRQGMVKDHERATGKSASTLTKNQCDKKTPQKGDLTKDFNRSR